MKKNRPIKKTKKTKDKKDVAVSCGYATYFAVKTCDGLCHFIYLPWHWSLVCHNPITLGWLPQKKQLMKKRKSQRSKERKKESMKEQRKGKKNSIFARKKERWKKEKEGRKEWTKERKKEANKRYEPTKQRETMNRKEREERKINLPISQFSPENPWLHTQSYLRSSMGGPPHAAISSIIPSTIRSFITQEPPFTQLCPTHGWSELVSLDSRWPLLVIRGQYVENISVDQELHAG